MKDLRCTRTQNYPINPWLSPSWWRLIGARFASAAPLKTREKVLCQEKKLNRWQTIAGKNSILQMRRRKTTTPVCRFASLMPSSPSVSITLPLEMWSSVSVDISESRRPWRIIRRRKTSNCQFAIFFPSPTNSILPRWLHARANPNAHRRRSDQRAD